MFKRHVNWVEFILLWVECGAIRDWFMSKSDQELISLIVVNKGDKGIENTLRASTKIQDDVQLEIIVVDASDGSFSWLKDDFPEVRWIDFPAGARGVRTIAQQRNVGLAAAGGETIIFLDSNCVPEPGWIESITQPIQSGQSRIVMGLTRSLSGSTVHDQVGRRSDVIEFSTTNIAFARSIFDDVGLFDESIGLAEDVDLSWRVSELGIPITYNANAVVTHDWGDWKEEFHRAVRYGRGRARLYRRNPKHWKQLLRADFNVLAYGVLFVVLIGAIFEPLILLVALVPLVKNARSHPFKTVCYNVAYEFGVIREIASWL